MAEQLVFNLPARPALGRADFFVSPMNEPAVQAIEGWRDWPRGKLALWGPEASGKTHLAHVWADLSDAEIVSAGLLVSKMLIRSQVILRLKRRCFICTTLCKRRGGHCC
jgi:chromosomal replication initiation ATPase DnaA